MDYSIQLSNVYDMFEADPDATLKKVAEIGYKCVEFCSFAGKTMEELKAMLDKYGLKVTGAHIPTFMLKDDVLEQTIADMKILGNKNIVIPCIGGKLDDAIALINRIQPIIEANGMSLHLHNHSGEFAPNADGIVPYDEFITRTNLNFQVDILYAANGGHDPLELIDAELSGVSPNDIVPPVNADHLDGVDLRMPLKALQRVDQNRLVIYIYKLFGDIIAHSVARSSRDDDRDIHISPPLVQTEETLSLPPY